MLIVQVHKIHSVATFVCISSVVMVA